MTKDDKGKAPVSIDNTEKNCMTSFAILAYSTVICDILWISTYSTHLHLPKSAPASINKHHFLFSHFRLPILICRSIPTLLWQDLFQVRGGFPGEGQRVNGLVHLIFFAELDGIRASWKSIEEDVFFFGGGGCIFFYTWNLGGGFKDFVYFGPTMGRWSSLTKFFFKWIETTS